MNDDDGHQTESMKNDFDRQIKNQQNFQNRNQTIQQHDIAVLQERFFPAQIFETEERNEIPETLYGKIIFQLFVK